MTFFYDKAISQVHGFEVVGGSAKAKVKGGGGVLIPEIVKDFD